LGKEYVGNKREQLSGKRRSGENFWCVDIIKNVQHASNLKNPGSLWQIATVLAVPAAQEDTVPEKQEQTLAKSSVAESKLFLSAPAPTLAPRSRKYFFRLRL
jgi:hypothetical protein